MNEEERLRLLEEIGKRKGEPGIVLEWHQVEMRRRYELEWESKVRAAREAGFLADDDPDPRPIPLIFDRQHCTGDTPPEDLMRPIPDFPNIYQPPPAPPADVFELMRQRAAEALEWNRTERRAFMKWIRSSIDAGELAQFREYLKNTRRRFPQNKSAFCRSFKQFERSLVKWRLLRPPQTLWQMEMEEHTRMAYKPFRIRDRPFSEMSECSIWTGTDSLPPYLVKGRGRPPGPRKVQMEKAK